MKVSTEIAIVMGLFVGLLFCVPFLVAAEVGIPLGPVFWEWMWVWTPNFLVALGFYFYTRWKLDDL